jgi:hypothetical protein
MCWFGIGTKPNWEVGVSSALFLMEVRYCCWPTPIQNWSVWLALVLVAMASLWVDHRKIILCSFSSRGFGVVCPLKNLDL